MKNMQLTRNAFGRLVFIAEDGTTHVGVAPVRAFPIAAPEDGLALMSAEGRELAWFERLADVPDGGRALIEQELASREFLPEISRILHVSSFATPSTWDVDTDRGETRLVLKGEENIRRISQSRLLIADSHGVQFLIRDIQALDRGSRKLLDRFL